MRRELHRCLRLFAQTHSRLSGILAIFGILGLRWLPVRAKRQGEPETILTRSPSGESGQPIEQLLVLTVIVHRVGSAIAAVVVDDPAATRVALLGPRFEAPEVAVQRVHLPPLALGLRWAGTPTSVTG